MPFLLNPYALAPTIIVPHDPLFANVTLLTNVVGGSIVDQSQYGNTLTPTGVTVDTVNVAIAGTSSMKFTSTSFISVTPYTAAKFDLSSTNKIWTVEAYVYLDGNQSSIPSLRLDIAGNQGASTGWECDISSSAIGMTFPGFGGPALGAHAVGNQGWHHIVWQRNNSSYTAGEDGNMYSAVTYTGGGGANNFMKIGGNLNNSTTIAYHIQNLRMTVGVNRYAMSTGGYTVPTTFPTS